MLIHITPDHIRRGVTGNCSRCPIAIALQEILPGNAYIRVSLTNVVIGDWTKADAFQANRESSIQLPPNASAFIEQFDSNRDGDAPDPAPFTFNLSAECFMI